MKFVATTAFKFFVCVLYAVYLETMLVQLLVSVKRLMTILLIALEHLLLSVAPVMLQQVALGREALLAVFASERLLTGVHPKVNLKI